MITMVLPLDFAQQRFLEQNISLVDGLTMEVLKIFAQDRARQLAAEVLKIFLQDRVQQLVVMRSMRRKMRR